MQPLIPLALIAAAPWCTVHKDEFIAGPGFAVVADRRVFAAMAFMNAMGFADESKTEPMHPARVKARAMLAAEMKKHPRKAQAWKAWYDRLKVPSFVYQDLSLALAPDYPFAFVRPVEEMTYKQAAEKMRDLPAVLNEFWRIARLERIWKTVKPEYIAELRKYDLKRMESEMAFLWSYLRMSRQDSFTVVSVPNLLDERYSAIGAKYGDAYFSVESPGALSHGLNVHEYLHSIVNPLVRANFGSFRPKLLAYYESGKSGRAAATYQEPVTYTSECLVRTLDKRILGRLNGISEQDQRTRGELAYVIANGLKLAGEFHALLGGFERSGLRFDQYVPVLLDAIPEFGR